MLFSKKQSVFIIRLEVGKAKKQGRSYCGKIIILCSLTGIDEKPKQEKEAIACLYGVRLENYQIFFYLHF